MSSNFDARVQQHTSTFVKAIERIYEEKSEVYITRAENISRENDRLRKELFELNQRVKTLTDRLGFEDLDKAEESLDQNLVYAAREHKATTARLEALTAELKSAKDQLALEKVGRAEDQQRLETLTADLARKEQLSNEVQSASKADREALSRLRAELQAEWEKTDRLDSMLSAAREENEAISSERNALKAAAAKDRAQRASLVPETPLRPQARPDDTDHFTPHEHLSALASDSNLPVEVQLAHLRTQYDELLASKVQLSEKYAQDMARWKTFREGFLHSSGGSGLIMTEGRLKTRRRVSKQGKDSPTPAGRTANIPLPQITALDDEAVVKEEENTLPPRYMHRIQRLQMDAGLEGPAIRRNISPGSNTDTQESSNTSPPEQPSFARSSQSTTTRGQPVRPPLTIKQSLSDDESGSALSRRQVSITTPLARSHSSPAESPHHRKKTAASAKSLGKRKIIMLDGEDDSAEEQTDSLTGDKTLKHETREERDARLSALRRKSGPQALADYQQYKGRGRYATESSRPADKTINGEYEIDPTRNDGVAFEFDSVVRNKNERRKMNAGDCIACREYYEAVGPMPKRTGAPLWRSPPREGNQPSQPHTCKHHRPTADVSTDQGGDTAAHKQSISRHRHQWAPASTPPGYWNIGFPDTQQVEDINRRAVEMHDKKRNAVEQEAGREGGRYRKRA